MPIAVIKKNKNALLLISLDVLLITLIFLLYNIFRPDIILVVVYISLFFYLALTKRSHSLLYLVISTLLALFWMLIANNMYNHNLGGLKIFGLNLYPLLAWATGLFGVYLIFIDAKKFLKKELKSVFLDFIIFVLVYWFFLIAVESLAYHVLDIKNLATANFPGLPICQCIHAPTWMQIAYFLMGPIYYIIIKFFDKLFNHQFTNKLIHQS